MEISEITRLGFLQIHKPSLLPVNRFDANGEPLNGLLNRYARVRYIVSQVFPDFDFEIFLGGSSVHAAMERLSRDYDWIVLLPYQENLEVLVEYSDLLTAAPGINNWLTDQQRNILRFDNRQWLAGVIQKNKNNFDDIIVRSIENIERNKVYYSIERNAWYKKL